MIKNQNVYPSSKLYGLNIFFIKYFKLDKNFILPITIPHGVMLKNEYREEIDVHCHEPLYMSFNKEIYNNVYKIKKTFCFPHPWLLVTKNYKKNEGRGTLIILPPPNKKIFTQIYSYIKDNNFSEPIGVLIKKRNDLSSDFDWWKERNIETFSAGDIYSEKFYSNLYSIFSKFKTIATVNMSSAAIFAASIEKNIKSIPNIVISTIEDRDKKFNFYKLNSKEYLSVQKIWSDILSNDFKVSSKAANNILGKQFLDSDKNLKEKLLSQIISVRKTPFHLHPLNYKKHKIIYKLIILFYKFGIPIQKLFPNPIKKILKKIKILFKIKSIYITKISDFSYFKICGNYITPEILKIKQSKIKGPITPGVSLKLKDQ